MIVRKLRKPDVSIEEALKEPDKWIPNDCYCYYGDYLCPFWELKHDKYLGKNGYCHYLKHDDAYYVDRDYLSLLFDMVKECGINWGEDD